MPRKKSQARHWVLFAAALPALPLAVLPPTSASAATATDGASTSWLGDTATGISTSLRQVRTLIGADTGAAAGLTGKGVGVALIDTGVAPVAGLPAANIVNGPDLSFESQAPNLRYLDTFGHGTHMAGIIVGNDTASGAVGIAPGAKLTSVKVGTANGAVDVSQVIAAVDWVVAHRRDDPANPIKVINLSYGSGGTPQFWNDSLGFAVEKAWQAGIVVVAAAGNNGAATAVLANPASDEAIISVGAAATKGTTTPADDEMASFTQMPLNGGKQVDILAPGVGIESLRDSGSFIDTDYPAARVGTTLFRGTGTSQATAITSAAVALLLEAKPNATPDQIKSWVRQSATYIPTPPASYMGLKEINVNAALARTGIEVPAQSYSRSTGTGSLDAARGVSRVVYDGVALSGDASVWGPLSTTTWAARATAGTSWSGGTWMGFPIAGSGWTGTSWASKTWAASSWANRPWNGASDWSDPGWSGRTWSGRTWSGGTWTGRTWAADDWSSAYWG